MLRGAMMSIFERKMLKSELLGDWKERKGGLFFKHLPPSTCFPRAEVMWWVRDEGSSLKHVFCSVWFLILLCSPAACISCRIIISSDRLYMFYLCLLIFLEPHFIKLQYFCYLLSFTYWITFFYFVSNSNGNLPSLVLVFRPCSPNLSHIKKNNSGLRLRVKCAWQPNKTHKAASQILRLLRWSDAVNCRSWPS